MSTIKNLNRWESWLRNVATDDTVWAFCTSFQTARDEATKQQFEEGMSILHECVSDEWDRRTAIELDGAEDHDLVVIDPDNPDDAE